MTSYAALLRGVNLGSSNKVAMPALRALASGLGYGDPSSYINSGNLMFTSRKRPTTLVVELQGALASQLGLRTDIAVRTRAQLSKALGLSSTVRNVRTVAAVLERMPG